MVHDGGALLAFVCGVVYTLLQSIISYKSCPQWNSLSTCHVRMAISAVSCAAVIPSILWAFVSVLASLTPPSPCSYSPKMEKAKADSQLPTGFRRTTGQITRKIAQSCLVKSKESLGERMVWRENGKKMSGHFSLCLLSFNRVRFMSHVKICIFLCSGWLKTSNIDIVLKVIAQWSSKKQDCPFSPQLVD